MFLYPGNTIHDFYQAWYASLPELSSGVTRYGITQIHLIFSLDPAMLAVGATHPEPYDGDKADS
jgi:hypothetical protein